MGSFVPAFPSFVDVDAPAWNRGERYDDVAPDTVRSAGGFGHVETVRPGAFGTETDEIPVFVDDEEPITLRSSEIEIRAAAPRALRSIEPGDYVFEAEPPPPSEPTLVTEVRIRPRVASQPAPLESGIVPRARDIVGEIPEQRPFVAVSEGILGFVCKVGAVVERIVAA